MSRRMSLPFILGLTCTALSACSAPPSGSGAAANAGAPHVAPPAREHASEAARPRQPSKSPEPGTVIEAVFDEAGDGSSSYDVGNGSRATYWFGYRYDVAGKPYFTGFVEQSPDHFGPAADADDPPSAKATLTQATFTAAPTGRWTFVNAQRSIVEIGTRGRADSADPARRTTTFPISDGRFILAIPTESGIEQGTVQKNYEVLLHAANGAWSHLATINAGFDDSAGCDQGRAFPCTGELGQLDFVAATGMPTIRVSFPASTRPSRAARVVTYTFDPATSTYPTP